ncbi:MAG: Flp pilus assembly complex ATPase component TadA, partial [Rhodobacteraceae bacterium]|nr:Flp pilus assembly complex ATPase component TadA [Paracoccaceae bacterium]
MFSKYKKAGSAKPAKGTTNVTNIAEGKPAAPVAVPAPQESTTLRRPLPQRKTEVKTRDKDRKRKERMGEIKQELHRALLETLNLAALEHASESELRSEITTISSEILEERGIVLNREDRQLLNKELYDEVTGLGPLETLLQDDTVNDILVNGPDQVFVERDGKLELSTVTFKDEKHLLRIIDKIVSAVGRRVDESNPYVDARLQDGSRFNAMVPPVAVDGSLVSIRKFKKDKLGIDDLVDFGAFSEEMAAYLQAAVSCRLNIIVSGG